MTAQALMAKFDSRCYWCKSEVYECARVGQKHPKLATVDHIRSKQECLTKKEYKSNRNQVLACQACNAKRNNKWIARVNAGVVVPLTVVTKKKKYTPPPPNKIIETIPNPARWYPIKVPDELNQAFGN